MLFAHSVILDFFHISIKIILVQIISDYLRFPCLMFKCLFKWIAFLYLKEKKNNKKN